MSVKAWIRARTWPPRRNPREPRGRAYSMYIGIGTLLVVIIILLLIFVL